LLFCSAVILFCVFPSPSSFSPPFGLFLYLVTSGSFAWWRFSQDCCSKSKCESSSVVGSRYR
jgi:hypothetical protein